MIPYEHTQAGMLIRWGVGGAAVLGVVLAATVGGAAPVGIALGFTAIMILVLFLFGSLTVRVDSREVVARFGIGPIRKTIPVAEVAAAKPVRNSWWYGWGIRLTPHGWMYNVSGLDAVEVEFRDGKRFRIGTDEPERLASAIEEAARGGRR